MATNQDLKAPVLGACATSDFGSDLPHSGSKLILLAPRERGVSIVYI